MSLDLSTLNTNVVPAVNSLLNQGVTPTVINTVNFAVNPLLNVGVVPAVNTLINGGVNPLLINGVNPTVTNLLSNVSALLHGNGYYSTTTTTSQGSTTTTSGSQPVVLLNGLVSTVNGLVQGLVSPLHLNTVTAPVVAPLTNVIGGLNLGGLTL